MNKNGIKNWTILIYASGNNELAPEIWKSKIDAEKFGSKDQVNVIMQIGRESRQLVKMIRPSDLLPEEEESWTGVRRYYILNTKSILLKDLGKINTADPHKLYDFIKWGIETYRAKHYMVILAGHGVSFIAVMPDLSQSMPYMMGVPQMCKVLNMIGQDTGVKIDILVLDMCKMNTIEIINELGRKKDNTVQNVITYIRDGPLSGLPYDKLICSIEQSNNDNDIVSVIKSIINGINLNLVAIEINHKKLNKIKEIVNSLAYSYLTNDKYKEKTPYELINNLDNELPWYRQAIELQNSLSSLIIYSKKVSFIKGNIIDITTNQLSIVNELNIFVLIYYSLNFSEKNHWFYVLTNKSLDDKINFNMAIPLEPMIMEPTGLRNIIWTMNPSLNEEEKQFLLDELFSYKNWNCNNLSAKLIQQTQKALFVVNS